VCGCARFPGSAWPAAGAQSEQRQDADVTADLLRTGWGRLPLVLAGVLVVAAGVEAGRRPVRLDFRERFTLKHMSRALAILTRALGALGCVARSAVFVLVGVFLLKAAVLSSAKQAKTLSAAPALRNGRFRERSASPPGLSAVHLSAGLVRI
jgi:hypothetical protein